VLEGGVKGALSSVEDKTAPKLYCISGKHRFKVSSVPVEAASLNSQDGFVLDCGSEDLIVQWVNANASPALKFRTLDLADELEQEYHAGHATVSFTNQMLKSSRACVNFTLKCAASRVLLLEVYRSHHLDLFRVQPQFAIHLTPFSLCPCH
jgi:hypothetical protein